MVEIKQSDVFYKWRRGIKDHLLRGLVSERLRRLRKGHFGDARPIGQGLSELRIHYGAGYRIYLQQRGNAYVLLLCGGDKSGQQRDIERAKIIAREWKD